MSKEDNYHYGWQQLHFAILSLCGAGSLHERLVDTIASRLMRITPKEDIPEELQKKFHEFSISMGMVPDQKNEGTIQATIENLDETALIEATKDIVSFYDKVCRYQER